MSADILGAVVDEALCEHPGSEGTDWHPRTADCTCGCGSCVDAARGQPDGATTRPEVTCTRRRRPRPV